MGAGRALLPAFALALLLLAAGACQPSDATDFSFQPLETTNADFDPVTFLTVGNFPVALATADVDGDGDSDVAVVNQFESLEDPETPAEPRQPGTVMLFLNDGQGGLTESAVLDAGIRPARILFAQLNGDGLPDIALLTGSATQIKVFLSDGSGGYAATVYPLPGVASQLKVIDLNGDGLPAKDLIVSVTDAISSLETGAMFALANDGNGAFTLVRSPLDATGAYPNPGAFIIEDWNGDGLPDLAILELLADVVVIMLGDGKAGFTPVGAALQVGATPFDLVADDFIGNGVKDIILTARASGRLWLLDGLGDGEFSISQFSPIALAKGGGAPERLVLGDFTGDGQDLIVVQRSRKLMTMLDWSGGGNFTLSALEVSRDPFAAVQGDFNRDGNNDLISAEKQYHLLSVHVGDGEGHFARSVIGFDTGSNFPTPVDLDGDGGLDLLFVQPASDQLGVLINCHPPSGSPCE